MKLRKTLVTLLFLAVCGSFITSACLAASLDITNIKKDGQTLTLTAVIDGGGNALKSGGFVLTFPSDRLEFTGSKDINGVIIKSAAQGNSVNAGYMVAGGEVNRLNIDFNFLITGTAPYIIAAGKDSLTDDLAGSATTRPGIYGNPTPDKPVVWSVPDTFANLFMYIPDLAKITDAKLSVGGSDVLAEVIAVSSWYIDPVMDVAYLVLPGVTVPAGSYPVTLLVQYDERTELSSTDVIVK